MKLLSLEPKACCLLAFDGGSILQLSLCSHWDGNSILLPAPSTDYLQDIDEYSNAVMGDGYELMFA